MSGYLTYQAGGITSSLPVTRSTSSKLGDTMHKARRQLRAKHSQLQAIVGRAPIAEIPVDLLHQGQELLLYVADLG